MNNFEEKDVIELAKQHGIMEIEEIRPYKEHFGSSCKNIIIDEKEIIKGNKVTFKRLFVGYKKWNSYDGRRNFKQKSVGEFFSQNLGTITKYIVSYNREKHKIHLNNISVEQSELFLCLIHDKNYTVLNDIIETDSKLVKMLDIIVTQPLSVGKNYYDNDDVYYARFQSMSSPSGTTTLKFLFKNNIMIILESYMMLP